MTKYIGTRTLRVAVVIALACCPVLIIGFFSLNNNNRSPNVRVQFVNAQVGWIVGPRLLQTTDGGRTWNQIRSDGYGTFEAESIGFGHRVIQFIDPNYGVQVDLNGIAKTADGGRTWSDQFALPKRNKPEIPSGSVFFLSPETGWLVCEAVYYTRDGGRNWQLLSPTPRGIEHRQRDMRVAPTVANFIPALWFTDTKNGLMARMDGEVYRTNDGGTTWDLIWEVKKKITDIYFANSQDGWLAGEGGFVARTNDSGKTWTPASTQTNADLTSIFFLTKQLGWVAGSESTILYTRDGGLTWQRSSVAGLSGSPPLASISFTDHLHGWAVGGNSDPMEASLFAPSNVVLSTDDGGQTWRSVRP
jgi:photosystem II stability/assembly factor-like uncharacterized protein